MTLRPESQGLTVASGLPNRHEFVSCVGVGSWMWHCRFQHAGTCVPAWQQVVAVSRSVAHLLLSLGSIYGASVRLRGQGMH